MLIVAILSVVFVALFVGLGWYLKVLNRYYKYRSNFDRRPMDFFWWNKDKFLLRKREQNEDTCNSGIGY